MLWRSQQELVVWEVGFLRTQHKYEIVFTLPELPFLGKDVCPAPVPNPHLRITDIKLMPEGMAVHPTHPPPQHQSSTQKLDEGEPSQQTEWVQSAVEEGLDQKGSSRLGWERDVGSERQTAHLRASDGRQDTAFLRVTCEYMAHQEGVLQEEMVLVSESKEDACLRVRVQARVMGRCGHHGNRYKRSEQEHRHHGTPMLLEGVRCVGAELEYDSEQSDWQGFD
ncbi:hypothetical protein JZ751_008957 [Albula glossodonta]|uniref:Adipose-secreted signaling protein n=1 Tax=Albula glossodonta TaxID=121402 RepID=A0A8T2P3A5_9TELE|nr:hypothetical protein JZ751_008957 [Albula glossodonta]